MVAAGRPRPQDQGKGFYDYTFDADASSRATRRCAGRRARAAGHHVPSAYGGRRARQPRELRDARGAERRVRVDRRHDQRAQLAGLLAARQVGHEAQKPSTWLPEARDRRVARRLLPVRGLAPAPTRRRCAARPSATATLRAERRQAVDHDRHEADFFVVFARTGPDRVKGISAFLVEKSDPGSSSARRSASSASAARRPPRSCSRTCACRRANLLGEARQGLQRSRSTRSTAAASASPRSRSASRAPAVDLRRSYACASRSTQGPIADFDRRSSGSSPTCRRPRRLPHARGARPAARSRRALQRRGGDGEAVGAASPTAPRADGAGAILGGRRLHGATAAERCCATRASPRSTKAPPTSSAS
jgi:hypothetical protein